MESPYADFYVIPLPKRNLRAYRTMAKLGRKVFLAHGALEYREYAGESLASVFGCLTFPSLSKARKGETVVAAIVGFRSRAHRDRVMKKVFADPAMDCAGQKKMPFDPSRMACGGFTRLV